MKIRTMRGGSPKPLRSKKGLTKAILRSLSDELSEEEQEVLERALDEDPLAAALGARWQTIWSQLDLPEKAPGEVMEELPAAQPSSESGHGYSPERDGSERRVARVLARYREERRSRGALRWSEAPLVARLATCAAPVLGILLGWVVSTAQGTTTPPYEPAAMARIAEHADEPSGGAGAEPLVAETAGPIQQTLAEAYAAGFGEELAWPDLEGSPH